MTSSPWYGHPKLQWEDPTKTDDFRTHWEVWRKFTSWSKLVTVTDGTNLWVDWTYDIGEKDAQYKVRAKNGDAVSTWSNIIGYYASKKESSSLNPNSLIYELKQNYPNPFNPITTISFTLKEDSYVILRVYDVLGREVDILVNTNLPAGVHSVEFNGQRFESGLYFYEIKARTFKDIKKLILLK